MQDPVLILADTIPQAYTQLAERFDSLSAKTELYNVSVHIRKPDKSASVPQSYLFSKDTVQALARKWQSRKLPSDGSLYFTHGQRIYEYGSEYHRSVDQFDSVAQLLARAPFRRRAVISLLDPTLDTKRTHDAPIPSFNLVQFFIEDRLLHVTAYYRAQEMSKFWVVNMQELLLLSGNMIERLWKVGHIRYEVGTITTHATQAYWDESFTLLEKPLLERFVDKLSKITYDIFISSQSEALTDLIRYLENAVKGHSYVELAGFDKLLEASRWLLETVVRDQEDPSEREDQRKKIEDFMYRIHLIRENYCKLREYLAERNPESEKVRTNLEQQVAELCTWLQSL